jgi:hypothetical protein
MAFAGNGGVPQSGAAKRKIYLIVQRIPEDLQRLFGLPPERVLYASEDPHDAWEWAKEQAACNFVGFLHFVVKEE